MEQAFLVTVRIHHGRFHGLDGRRASEWPPSPARLFQAILAGAAHGDTLPKATLDALEWLQSLPPPVIAAPRGTLGQGFLTYVPSNDLDAKLRGSRFEDAVAETRVGKRIRPTLFDLTAPVCYCWTFDDSEGDFTEALCIAADSLYQLGRGVDMAWAKATVVDREQAEQRLRSHQRVVYEPSAGAIGKQVLACPGPGLLESLLDRYGGIRERFRSDRDNGKQVEAFVQPPRPRFLRVAYGAQPHRLVFELRESDARAAFSPWPLNRATGLVETVRDRAAAHLINAVPDLRDSLNRFLIGRDAGEADKLLRVGIVPIPSIGHEHSDLSIRRLVVRVPQPCPISVGDVAWAFSQVTWTDDDGVVERELLRVAGYRMASRFDRSARCWQSVTPLALPKAKRRRIDPSSRADEAKGGTERVAEESLAIAALKHALRHAAVSTIAKAVHVQREPFDRHGDRAEHFAPGTRFPKEVLWHASITFEDEVPGPLVLGDGRYLGLGLMRPVEEPTRGVIVFSIVGGLTETATWGDVARAARRAMMARVQARLPRGENLPIYVSGHTQGESHADDMVHRHIAVIADLPRRRLLFVAPTQLQRRGLRWHDINLDHRLTEAALHGMDVLRAGSAGRLNLTATALDPEQDALFASTKIWESVTDYQVTRHRAVGDAHNALELDVVAELERVGWPRPEAVEVMACRGVPGDGLSGRLRLRFRTVQAGPLAIGRSAHKGGGLFSGCCR